jgi:hypothetical protein
MPEAFKRMSINEEIHAQPGSLCAVTRPGCTANSHIGMIRPEAPSRDRRRLADKRLSVSMTVGVFE